MGQNICLKLSLLGNVLVLDKVADVMVHVQGKVYNWSRCVSDSTLWQKNWMKQFFFPFPVTEACDSCNSFGLANREVSVLNQLYSKGMVCLCFSTRRNSNPGPFYFKRNTHTEQTFSRSGIGVLCFPPQEQFFLLRKRHRIHSCCWTEFIRVSEQ